MTSAKNLCMGLRLRSRTPPTLTLRQGRKEQEQRSGPPIGSENRGARGASQLSLTGALLHPNLATEPAPCGMERARCTGASASPIAI